MTGTAVATIPGGFRLDGDWCCEVQLRELTGEDHAFLVEDAGTLLPAFWTTELLRRCATRAGSGEALAAEQIRSLTVGDREALTLQLRRLTSGDRIHCVLNCPSADCGQKLDLELRVSDLLTGASGRAEEFHEAEVADGDAQWRVRFRLPNGSDQEAAASLARADVNAAVDLLLARTAGEQELPEQVRQQLPQLMAELDPQAEIELQITCQECGEGFKVLFDAAGYFFQELKAGLPLLFHEVHLLAYHYHWSLREILAMGARTRRRYIRLLEEELAGAAS
jgi:hypothetical protein